MAEYLALLIIGLFVVLVLAWNFIPSWRAMMKGMSTKAEALGGLLLYQGGVFSDAVAKVRDMDLLPDHVDQYAAYFIAAYVIIKRLQTKTPAIGMGMGKI